MLSVMFVWLLGCDDVEYEGDVSGECADGADNNGDDRVDCDDPVCAAAPECGCGDDVVCACDEFFFAHNTCLAAYAASQGVDTSDSFLVEGYCEDTYSGMQDEVRAQYLECLAEAYSAADCSGPDGYTSVDYSACTI